MKKLRKDTLREIRKSLGRFFSILAIVAIGVAFYAGVKASAPVMKYTADEYFDENNLMDIRVLSTIGLSDDDVEEIRKMEGVLGVYPTHTLDAIVNVNAKDSAVTLMTLPDDVSLDNEDYMNRPVLTQGRLPEKENECVVEDGKMIKLNLNIGDTIVLKSGTKDSILDTLKVDTFTIVGKVQTPYYLSYQKGSTNIGNGTLDSFIMVKDSVFDLDYYTDLYLTVEGVKQLNSYEDEYFDIIDPLVDRLEDLGKVQARVRTQEIKDEATQEYNDGLEEYYDAKKEAEDEIADAKRKLDNAYLDLVDGQRELDQNRVDFEKEVDENREKIADGRQQLEDARKDLSDKEKEFQQQKEETLQQLEPLKTSIDEADAQLEPLLQQKAELEEAMQNPQLPSSQLKQLQRQLAQVEGGIAQIEEQIAPYRTQYEDAMLQLENGEKQLLDGKQEIENKQKELDDSEISLEEGIITATQEFADAQADINQGWVDYEEGLAELEKNQKIADEELQDAREELEQAEADILALEDGEWYVLSRESHYSYMDYGSAADRMGAIATIFPLFFFLVAALICLTTMTRMVDEQRETIGTYKALGYSKSAIASKYISYALLSSIVGSIVGVCVGFVVFPSVIYYAWNIMYQLPDVHLLFLGGLALQASGAAVLITVCATFFAVVKSLIETPALLMRPKAPKNGKRIFLEKIGFIWKRLSFSQKVSARNLIRYKKRFFMTVIGISGCTALLVAGFGIQDSIGDIVPKQFEEIQRYDANIEYEKDLNIVEKEEVLNQIKQLEDVEEVMEISNHNLTVNVNGKDQALTLIVPMDNQKFEEFVSLRTRKQHTPLQIQKIGAVISEKLANDLGLGVGDILTCSDSDDRNVKIEISGIAENYIGHYLYMDKESYKGIFGLSAKPTNILLVGDQLDVAKEDRLGREINQIDQVASVVFYRASEEQFSDTIKSLGFVVVVLIISAGLLAFVVLYNLTNVNISERIREIATIKVLGFRDKEVSSYVFRENLILSFIGSLVGLGLGTVLHRLIMNLAELDSVMFGRVIFFRSYVLSVIITMVFAWLVAKFMHKKLVKIPMVESLKSVE